MNFYGVRRGLSRKVQVIVLGTLAFATLCTSALVPQVEGRPTDPTRKDRYISIMVAAMMNRRHVTEMEVNDEISHRALDMFLKNLDPMKLFFLQSDVDEFQTERNKLDDYVNNGDLRVAKRIFDRFLQRVTEQVAVAQKLVDQKHDFTVDETMVRDPEKLEYAKSKDELDERWRKRVKYDLLVEIADDVDYQEAVEKLHKRYRGIRRNWEQTSNDDLLEDFLTAITSSFDPHSNYMSPSSFEDFKIRLRLELNGIGASLESKYGETIVRRIVPGGAADKDGRLKVDDVIVGVAEGMDGEFVDIVDMRITDVVRLIRGKPGTVVRLQVIPADKSGRKVYDITRARIELKDSEARSEIVERPLQPKAADGGTATTEATDTTAERPTGQIIDHQPTVDSPKHRIGIISLPSFYMDMDGRRAGNPEYKSTARDVRQILEEFNKQGVELVVMDLRFNGGGSLPESVDVTGLFIDKGPVVQVKGPDGQVQPYDDEDPGEVWSGPLIVLINRFSASASEIFAGAVQDYGRGIIVGDRSTHGKGSVQNLIDLAQEILSFKTMQNSQAVPNLGALKMTIQQFYRPGGDSTQIRGVESDIVLPARTSYWEGLGEDDLEYALKFDHVVPQPHLNYKSASPQIVNELRKRSAKRVANSDYFQLEEKKIEKLLERQKEQTVTLNKEKFMAERAEMNAEKDQEEMFDEMEEDGPVFAPTPYNEEVIKIALDYLDLLKSESVAAVAR